MCKFEYKSKFEDMNFQNASLLYHTQLHQTLTYFNKHVKVRRPSSGLTLKGKQDTGVTRFKINNQGAAWKSKRQIKNRPEREHLEREIIIE